MEIKNLVMISRFDKLPLHITVYEPIGEKKGILQILHGMCEYKERYSTFMEYFCDRGFVVICHDQRGHGDSVKAAEDIGYFYDNSTKAIVGDAVQITAWAKAEYPDLPITLFGHSMGSMVARCYLQEHDTLIDKAIICGSPSKNPLVGAAICLTKCIACLRGKRHRSKLLAHLSTGKSDGAFKGEGKGAWLSANRENIRTFYANPKRQAFTCNGFENLFKLMKYTYKKKRYQVKNPNLPIHFVSGGDDPLIGNAVKWVNGIELLRKVGYANVTGKLYQGMRHEIFHEAERETVLAELLAFIVA